MCSSEMKEVITWRWHSFVLLFYSVHRRLPNSATSLQYFLSFLCDFLSLFTRFGERSSDCCSTKLFSYMESQRLQLLSVMHAKNEEGAKIDLAQRRKKNPLRHQKQNNSKFHLRNNRYQRFLLVFLHYSASFHSSLTLQVELAKAKIGNLCTHF